MTCRAKPPLDPKQPFVEPKRFDPKRIVFDPKRPLVDPKPVNLEPKPLVDPKSIRDPKSFDPKLFDPKLFDPKIRDPKIRDPKGFDPKGFDPKGRDPLPGGGGFGGPIRPFAFVTGTEVGGPQESQAGTPVAPAEYLEMLHGEYLRRSQTGELTDNDRAVWQLVALALSKSLGES